MEQFKFQAFSLFLHQKIKNIVLKNDSTPE